MGVYWEDLAEHIPERATPDMSLEKVIRFSQLEIVDWKEAIHVEKVMSWR